MGNSHGSGDDHLAAPVRSTASQEVAGTFEAVPLSADQRAAIISARVTLRGAVIGVVVAPILGEAAAWLAHTWIVMHLVYAVVLPVLFLAVWVAFCIWDRLASRHDLRDGTLTRYTGPLRIETLVTSTTRRESSGATTVRESKTYKLHLGLTKVFSLPTDAGEELAALGLSSGRVDFANHTGEILEILDDRGQSVWLGDGMRKVAAARTAAGS